MTIRPINAEPHVVLVTIVDNENDRRCLIVSPSAADEIVERVAKGGRYGEDEIESIVQELEETHADSIVECGSHTSDVQATLTRLDMKLVKELEYRPA
jgi:hypothetical protein